MSQKDDEAGKLFVGGLSWETSQDNLCRFFGHFGEVVDCVVMKNNETGRSRGFGFVTFKDPNCVQDVLNSGPHTLDGRTIDPKICNPRSMQKTNAEQNSKKNKNNCPKIFLGGLPSNITETDLRNFFGKYGKVLEVVIMYDQEKKRSRGFGFLSFETEDSVDQVCAEHYVIINGKQVECKRAEPRDGPRSIGPRSGNHWNGAGMNMGMGPGGMPPPHMGGPMGGPAMGPPPMGGPMPNGMPGSIMGSGYQAGGWGGPQQGGSFGPGYGGPPPGPGYQGWGPSYGSYGGGPQYSGPSQGAYGGFGSGPGGGTYPTYNWGNPPGSAALPSSTGSTTSERSANYNQQQSSNSTGNATGSGTPTVSSAPAVTASTTSTTVAGQSVVKQEYSSFSSPYGSSYPQEASSYGPLRTYDSGTSHDSTTQNAGGYQSDPQPASYSSSQGGSYGQNATVSQRFHPFRRQ